MPPRNWKFDRQRCPGTKFAAYFNVTARGTHRLAHLAPEDILKLVASGERSTWRKIEMIRVQTHISRTLDKILEGFESEHLQSQKRLKQSRARRKAA